MTTIESSSTVKLLAIQEIKNVCHQYALGLDRFDMDLILSAFTSDAVFDATPFGLGAYKGHEAIKGFFQHNLDVMKSQMHLYSNFIITVVGPQDAEGTNYLLEEGFNTEDALIRCLGIDTDRYRKTSKGWKITERKIEPLIAPKLKGYIESL